MSRYKSRKPEAVIPEGWTEHDGTECPVDPLSFPGVLFRAGTRFQAGKRRAEEWQKFSSGDCWTWADRKPDSFDIIAYLPENEFIAIPRSGSVL